VTPTTPNHHKDVGFTLATGTYSDDDDDHFFPMIMNLIVSSARNPQINS